MLTFFLVIWDVKKAFWEILPLKVKNYGRIPFKDIYS